jgi:phosphoglycolate phosphatase
MLCEEIKHRGGECYSPEFYKLIYLDDFHEEVNEYKNWVIEGVVEKEKFMVPGILSFLEKLYNKGIILHIASGTDHKYLIEEVEILGISNFFESIEGASPHFSKKTVTQKIAKKAPGNQLIVFGDGFVEIQCAKEVGAIAVGIAIDTYNFGSINKKKKGKLIEAGADIIIPDFSQYSDLLQYLGV